MAKRLDSLTKWWLAIVFGVSVGASVTLPSCGPSEADRSAPATLGKGYDYELYTHCGVRSAVFDQGRWWLANPPIDDGRRNPPAGWGNPFTEGVMVLVREDLAVFTSESGQVVEFVPWPPGLNKEPCY